MTGASGTAGLHDEQARAKILDALDRTLFVDAGAGSGKTTALVGRVLALISAGVAMENIAAITFTEKAAAELRDRVRRKLEQAEAGTGAADTGGSAPGAGPYPATATAALQQLDGAAVGTLHSFAQRILAEHPTEAGLPPSVEVIDDIGSQIEFDDRWRSFAENLLDDPAAGVSLLVLELSGAGLEKLRGLAVRLNENWDLAEERIDRSVGAPDLAAVDATGAAGALADALAHRDDCLEAGDGLNRKLGELERRSDGLDSGDGLTRLAAVSALSETAKESIPQGTSYTRNWQNGSKVVRDAVKDLVASCQELLEPVTQAALEHIVALLATETLAAAEQRRAAGRLEFQDLLVRARRLLRDPDRGPEVRRALRDRYRRLLLDESQDTDPIQIELAVLIACADEHVDDTPWHDLAHEGGRLFLVGDPKQSIYRFRRADIATFLRAGRYVEEQPGGERLELFTNFRSTAPVIEWVNTVFEQVITPGGDSQPAYVPLAGVRPAASRGPGVAVLGAEPVAGADDGNTVNAEELRRLEAAAVAGAVASALDEGWDVHDDRHRGEERWRAAEPGDIAILLPARTSLEALEDALDAAGVAYRAETSTLVYATREVRDLMLAAQAVADPTDELAVVAALRSPLYGCGDDDLAHWKLGCRGRFSLLARQPPDAPDNHPVGDGIAHLRDLHDTRWWLTPAQLLERIIRERAALESAVATGRPRDVWRRLRFVVDQARAWSDAGGVGLRSYLQWARLQGADNAKVTETVLPETDDDSVRILTIHGAKGLQFPITVVSGMSSPMQRPPFGPTIAFPPGQPAVSRLSARVASEGYQQWQPMDEMMDEHERLRLLYVACTRARDHLVVSLHRTAEGRLSKGTLAAALAAADAAADPAEALEPGSRPPQQASPPAPVAALPPRGQWLAERDGALTAARRRLVTSATALASAAIHEADPRTDPGPPSTDLSLGDTGGPRRYEPTADPGLLKDERDAELPPWNKGRYGTAVGRAVHGVLQTVNLGTGAGLEAAARAQAMAESVPDRAAAVAQLARAALSTVVAREAAATWHGRELFVAAPLGDQLVEGYVDLVYRGPDGLVVVDWKTDSVAGDDDVEAKLARYRLQGAAYTAALEAVTGEQVARMVFVFLNRTGAIERDLPDLRAAVEEAKAAVARISG